MKSELKRKVVCLAAAIGMLSFPLVASAWPQFLQKQRHSATSKEKIASELNLSPEQTEQIREQRKEHHRLREELNQSVREKQGELKTELEKENADIKKVDTIKEDIKELQGKLIDNRVESILEMKETLTPEQYKEFHQRTRGMHRNKGMQGRFRKR